MKIKVVIMCHNKPQTTERLYNALKDVFSVEVIDSASDIENRPNCPHLVFPNLYWTGCWNKAIDLMTDEDVLWVIGGDIELRNSASEYYDAICSAYPFGLWSPGIEGWSLKKMNAVLAKDSLFSVRYLEGVAMAISKKCIDFIGKLDANNYLGWGQDLYLSWKSHKNRMLNLLDGRVRIYHPFGRGYDGELARKLCEEMWVNIIGEKWCEEIGFTQDNFEGNVIERIGGEKKKLTVVIVPPGDVQMFSLTLQSIQWQNESLHEIIVLDDGWLGRSNCVAITKRLNIETLTRYVSITNLEFGLSSIVEYSDSQRILFIRAGAVHVPNSFKSHFSLHANQMGLGSSSGMLDISIFREFLVPISNIMNLLFGVITPESFAHSQGLEIVNVSSVASFVLR